MIGTSNIIYNVDEENKIITATVDCWCVEDVIDDLLKSLRRSNLDLTNCIFDMKIIDEKSAEKVNPDHVIFRPVYRVEGDDTNEVYDMFYCSLTTCKKFLMQETYTGKAIYNPKDPTPFSIERGKEIARRRLYDAYNKDYLRAIKNIIHALTETLNNLCKLQGITEKRIEAFKYYEYYDIIKANLETD